MVKQTTEIINEKQKIVALTSTDPQQMQVEINQLLKKQNTAMRYTPHRKLARNTNRRSDPASINPPLITASEGKRNNAKIAKNKRIPP